MTRLIIDTDTAGDDCIALMMGLLHPNAELAGITMVAGNLPFEEQVRNALLTIDTVGRAGEVPVFGGARRPLTAEWVASAAHGDGKGGVEAPAPKQKMESEPAVSALLRMVEEGETSIVAIGPLTNIASACLMDPSFPEKVDRLFVMGGTYLGRGNITPAAEYNFFVDPEAAQIVMKAGFDLTLVTWTATLEYAVLTLEEGGSVVTPGVAASDFFEAINRPNAEYNATKRIFGSTHPDTLAVLTLLVPELVADAVAADIDVETGGRISRGACVVDVLADSPSGTVITEIDRTRFIAELSAVLGSGPLSPEGTSR